MKSAHYLFRNPAHRVTHRHNDHITSDSYVEVINRSAAGLQLTTKVVYSTTRYQVNQHTVLLGQKAWTQPASVRGLLASEHWVRLCVRRTGGSTPNKHAPSTVTINLPRKHTRGLGLRGWTSPAPHRNGTEAHQEVHQRGGWHTLHRRNFRGNKNG